MNKTPYEIRLDVAKLAKEMLDRKLEADMLKYNIDREVDPSVAMPSVYSTDDVLKTANELYSFVSTNSTTDASSSIRSSSSTVRRK